MNMKALLWKIMWHSNSLRISPCPFTTGEVKEERRKQSETRRKRLRLRPVSLREAYGLEALRERYHKSSIVNSPPPADPGWECIS
jgi:hypothetical protein